MKQSNKVYEVEDYLVGLKLEEDHVKITITNGNEIIGTEKIPPIVLISVALDEGLKNQMKLKSLKKAMDIESHIQELCD